MLDGEHTTVASRTAEKRAENEGNLTVHVSFRGVEKTFSGSVESVWLSLNRFFNDFLPSFETARRLSLNVDLQKLAKESEGIIGFSEDGPCLLIPRGKLTDNETLSLLLLAGYLAYHLGKAETGSVSKEELQSRLGKDAKITSTRLGELVKNQTAAKTSVEEYRITTLGLTQMQKDIIPRIKIRMNS